MGTIHRRLALAAPIALALLQLACTPAAAPPGPVNAPAPPVARTSGDPAALRVASSSDKPRTTDEVMIELRALEQLSTDTAPGSLEQPRIYRRLAEAYVELESAALRDQIDGETRGASRSPEAERLAGVVAAARHNAIKHYQVLATKYPTFCVSPGIHCGDEVLYHLAHEHEQANESNDARRVYLQLVKSFPQSTFLPHAYLAFGERLFVDAQSDPSALSLAEMAYIKAAEAPPPGNPVWGYAHYKLAFVHWNRGAMARALAELVQVIEFAAKFPSLPSAEKLGAMARKDLVPVYALGGDPAKAFDFFKPLSDDPAGETGRAMAMSLELGQSYLDTGHYKECVVLDLDLLPRAAGEPACVLLAQLDQAALRATKVETAALSAPLSRGKQLVEKARKSCPGQAAAVSLDGRLK